MGDGGGLTGGELEAAELPSRSAVARLELRLSGELKGKASEGEREPATLLVVNSRSSRSKGLVDLLNGRRHVRTVEHQIAGGEYQELEEETKEDEYEMDAAPWLGCFKLQKYLRTLSYFGMFWVYNI